MKEFKELCNKATDFIISCWDENNPNDGKNFDIRIKERISDLEPDVREIVENCCDW